MFEKAHHTFHLIGFSIITSLYDSSVCNRHIASVDNLDILLSRISHEGHSVSGTTAAANDPHNDDDDDDDDDAGNPLLCLKLCAIEVALRWWLGC
jgi:hypothetical protein